MIIIDGSQGQGGDQILGTALAGAGSKKPCPSPPPHALTTCQIIGLFLDVPITVTEFENHNVIVRVCPSEQTRP